MITAPADLQYDPAADDLTPLNQIAVSDLDSPSLTLTITRTSGDGTLSAISGGGVTVGGTAIAMTLSGTAAAINAFIAANAVILDTQGNDEDSYTLSLSDGTNTVQQTSFLVNDVTPNFANNSTNNLAGVNIYELAYDTDAGPGTGNDTVYSS